MTLNRPGHSARKIENRFYLNRVFIVLVGVFLLYLCIKLLTSSVAMGIGGPIAILVVIKVIDVIVSSETKSLKKSERKAARGAKAEKVVDDILKQMQGNYAVFHDVNTGHGDIDHIVLSREHGLFLLETKSHHGEVTVREGKILINGHVPEKDFIAQTLGNTMWLKQQIKDKTGLDVWIQPIIVFTNGFVKEWIPVRGIQLRNKKFLIETIKKAKANQALLNQLWFKYKEGVSLW